MSNILRSAEFVEGALAQRDPVRRLRLVERALEADADSPHAHAALGHLSPDAASAQACYGRAARLSRQGNRDVGADVRSCLELALAARDLAGADPHSAVERLLPMCRRDLPAALVAPAFRMLATAGAACGDWEAVAEALKRGRGLLGAEQAWFAWLLAKGFGEDGGDDLDVALFSAPEVVEPLVADTPKGLVEAGNPACASTDGTAGLMAARAAVAAALAQSFEAAGELGKRASALAA